MKTQDDLPRCSCCSGNQGVGQNVSLQIHVGHWLQDPEAYSAFVTAAAQHTLLIGLDASMMTCPSRAKELGYAAAPMAFKSVETSVMNVRLTLTCYLHMSQVLCAAVT